MLRFLLEMHPCFTFCRFDIWKKVIHLKWIWLPLISFACCQFPTIAFFFHSDQKKSGDGWNFERFLLLLTNGWKMDQLFYALTAILQPSIALSFWVHFFLRGSIKRLKTLKLQDHTYQDHFCSMCPRSLELSSSYTTNHDDELESLFLSGNQESVFMTDSIDDRSSGFTPDDGRDLSWVAIHLQSIFSLTLLHSPIE